MTGWFNSQAMNRAFRMVGNGFVPNTNVFQVSRHQLFHRVDVPAAGFTEQEFFNVTRSEFVCNLSQGRLEDETGFWATGLGITIETGRAVDGTADAGGGDQSVAAATAIDLAEWVREIVSGGLVTLAVADRTYVQDYGIGRFPAGGGMHASGALATTATSATHESIVVNNGAPMGSNRYEFRPMVPILPGKQIRGKIRFPAAIAPPSNTSAVIRFELDGLLVKPSNL